MPRYFINHPIVALVIAIIMMIVGLVSLAGLPVTQYPKIIPPEVNVITTYVGADALAIEQSVAVPLEEIMSGVDDMNYLFSINSNSGSMRMTVNFDVKTDPNIDQMLSQLRESQAERQFPPDVRNIGITTQKSLSTPLVQLALYSPNGTYDAQFLANYAYIHLNNLITRVRGIASVTVFGAGQYALRCWVRPDILAKLNITVPEIIAALQQQNTVNPAGQIGAEPVPAGQQFTYSIRAQGRLVTPEEFGQIVLRADSGGSLVRLKDVARIELGVQDYSVRGSFNGHPSAILSLYQLPGSNALQAAEGVRKVMEEAKKYFPPRPRLCRGPRYHQIGERRPQGDRADALHRPATRDSRGIRVPAGVPRNAHSNYRSPGIASRDLCLLPAARIFNQPHRSYGHGGSYRSRC